VILSTGHRGTGLALITGDDRRFRHSKSSTQPLSFYPYHPFILIINQPVILIILFGCLLYQNIAKG
jgi:hypothetical protein